MISEQRYLEVLRSMYGTREELEATRREWEIALREAVQRAGDRVRNARGETTTSIRSIDGGKRDDT